MKFAELPTTDRKDRPLEPVQNGIIKSVQLGDDEHGGLTAWLHVEGDGWGCGFGGYRLGVLDSEPDYPREPGNGNLDRRGYLAEFVARCIHTVLGTPHGSWESLAGEPVRVLSEGLGGGIVAIGNFLKDEWFCPRVEFGSVPSELTSDPKILRTRIIGALGRLGVVRAGCDGDSYRWSPSDLATDLAAELLK